MAIDLKEGCYDLQQNSSSKQLYLVKLTDSAIKAIEAYNSGQTSEKPSIVFSNNKGQFTIPGGKGSKTQTFTFQVSNPVPHGGSLQFIQQHRNQDEMRVVGQTTSKITINANDDSYQNTGNKIRESKMQEKQQSAKVLKDEFSGGKKMFSKLYKGGQRRSKSPNHPNTGFVHSSSSYISTNHHHHRSTAPNTNANDPTDLTQRKRSQPKRYKVQPPSSSTAASSGSVVGGNQTTASSSSSSTTSLPHQQFQLPSTPHNIEKVICQILVLRSHKLMELHQRVQSHLTPFVSHQTFTQALNQVALSNESSSSSSSRVFSLAPDHLGRVSTDWPGYTDEEKAQVPKKKALLVTSSSTTTTSSKTPPPLSSVGSAQSQQQQQQAEAMMMIEECTNAVRGGRKRVAHPNNNSSNNTKRRSPEPVVTSSIAASSSSYPSSANTSASSIDDGGSGGGGGVGPTMTSASGALTLGSVIKDSSVMAPQADDVTNNDDEDDDDADSGDDHQVDQVTSQYQRGASGEAMMTSSVANNNNKQKRHQHHQQSSSGSKKFQPGSTNVLSQIIGSPPPSSVRNNNPPPASTQASSTSSQQQQAPVVSSTAKKLKQLKICNPSDEPKDDFKRKYPKIKDDQQREKYERHGIEMQKKYYQLQKKLTGYQEEQRKFLDQFVSTSSRRSKVEMAKQIKTNTKKLYENTDFLQTLNEYNSLHAKLKFVHFRVRHYLNSADSGNVNSPSPPSVVGKAQECVLVMRSQAERKNPVISQAYRSSKYHVPEHAT